MKIRTAELEGAALDWAVAKALGIVALKGNHIFVNGSIYPRPSYSTDWSQGGPIIDRIAGFTFKSWLESKPESRCEAHIHNYDGDWIQFGPTPLIAAMRCFVAYKLGDTVEIPDEFAQHA